MRTTTRAPMIALLILSAAAGLAACTDSEARAPDPDRSAQLDSINRACYDLAVDSLQGDRSAAEERHHANRIADTCRGRAGWTAADDRVVRPFRF